MVVCVHATARSSVSVARADPASLRCARFEDARSRTTRRRMARRCCKPVAEVRSPPLSLCVVALILEPDRDAVTREAPEVLLQAVVELPGPLTLEERDDLLAALEELLAVAPLGVLGVGERDLLGIAGVPGVLGRFDLPPGTLLSKRRHGRSYLLILAALPHTLFLLSASTVGCPFYLAPALSSAVVSHQSIIFPGRIARPEIGLSTAPPSPWRKRGPSG